MLRKSIKGQAMDDLSERLTDPMDNKGELKLPSPSELREEPIPPAPLCATTNHNHRCVLLACQRLYLKGGEYLDKSIALPERAFAVPPTEAMLSVNEALRRDVDLHTENILRLGYLASLNDSKVKVLTTLRELFQFKQRIVWTHAAVALSRFATETEKAREDVLDVLETSTSRHQAGLRFALQVRGVQCPESESPAIDSDTVSAKLGILGLLLDDGVERESEHFQGALEEACAEAAGLIDPNKAHYKNLRYQILAARQLINKGIDDKRLWTFIILSTIS